MSKRNNDNNDDSNNDNHQNKKQKLNDESNDESEKMQDDDSSINFNIDEEDKMMFEILRNMTINYDHFIKYASIFGPYLQWMEYYPVENTNGQYDSQ